MPKSSLSLDKISANSGPNLQSVGLMTARNGGNEPRTQNRRTGQDLDSQPREARIHRVVGGKHSALMTVTPPTEGTNLTARTTHSIGLTRNKSFILRHLVTTARIKRVREVKKIWRDF